MAVLTGLGDITVLGCGKMGGAIVGGLVMLDGFDTSRLRVLESTEDHCSQVTDRFGVLATTDASQVFPADTLIIAVKPQVARGILEDLVVSQPLDGMLVISIAAGITTSQLEEIFPDSCPVVRVMPNTPLLVSAGMSTVSGGARSTDAQVASVCDLFASIGTAIPLDEAQQDASCALNGSGPAYFARACTALADAGVAEGLDPETAVQLAVGTMYGTAKLLMEGGLSTEELVTAVSSPGGTTVAALEAMEEAGFSDALAKGVQAAVRRSQELAR